MAQTTAKSGASVARINPNERERATVEAVIQTELPWIRRRLRTLFPTHLDLDEVEQQVLLNVLRSWPTYRGDGSVRRWVDSIALRVGVKHARRVRLRQRSEQALFEARSDALDYSLADACVQAHQLNGLLSALPPEQARALVLRFVGGLRVCEIAAEEGVPEETARSRVRRGLQKLRRRTQFRIRATR